MQSSNPVFTRSEGFNGRGGTTYAGFGNAPVTHTTYGGVQTAPGRMTIDSVVQKTGLTLGVVLLAAAATWILSGDLFDSSGTVNTDVASRLYVLTMVGAFGALALSFVNSFKRSVSPGLVLAYAALEGVALGGFSKVIEAQFGGGIVIGAVLGTVGAFAGTLFAYKVLDIRVSDKFRKVVIAAMFGFVAMSLLDFVLQFFKADIGFNGFGTVGLLASIAGLGIGILMLILDFDMVEKGIAAGLPERESWRAAFGLTVTLVWIYVELLRILAILRGD